MEQKLAQSKNLSQKDKGPAYSALLSQTLSNSSGRALANDLHFLVDALVTQDCAGLVVGRQVLTELVKALKDGVVKDREIKKHIVKDTLAISQPRLVSYEEQVCKKIYSSRAFYRHKFRSMICVFSWLIS